MSTTGDSLFATDITRMGRHDVCGYGKSLDVPIRAARKGIAPDIPRASPLLLRRRRPALLNAEIESWILGDYMTRRSYWAVGPKLPKFDRLEKDLKVDVAVVGGGITGVTAAYLLKKAGCSVALLERDCCGGVDTGHTTCISLSLPTFAFTSWWIVSGAYACQAAWDAGRAAIDQIDEIVQEEDLSCEFTWVPGYLHACRGDSSAGDRKQLERDV